MEGDVSLPLRWFLGSTFIKWVICSISGAHRLHHHVADQIGMSLSSNKKLLVTSASLLVTSALLVVTMFATRNKFTGFRTEEEPPRGAEARRSGGKAPIHCASHWGGQSEKVKVRLTSSFLLLVVRHLLLLAWHLLLLAYCF